MAIAIIEAEAKGDTAFITVDRKAVITEQRSASFIPLSIKNFLGEVTKESPIKIINIPKYSFMPSFSPIKKNASIGTQTILSLKTMVEIESSLKLCIFI